MVDEDDEGDPPLRLRRDVSERLTAWAETLAPKTSESYRQSLRRIAVELGEEDASGIFLRLARSPVLVHERLTAFAADGEGKSNTRRKHLIAVNSAHRALVGAGVELPEMRVLLPERDVKLECVATAREEIRAVELFLARQPSKRDKRTAAALALAAAALRAHEIVSLRFDVYAPSRIAIGGVFLKLPADLDAAVYRWWEDAEAESARPFELTTRSLQRDVAELAADMAPTLSLEGVRRRAIVDAYLAGGAHAAAAFARTSNPSEVRRIVQAAGERWIPDRSPRSARGRAPGTPGTRGRKGAGTCS